MADKYTDISFTIDSTKKMLYTSGGERARNTIYRLFTMKQGEDMYNPTMGLDYVLKLFQGNATNYEDTDYESEIRDQINTYTNYTCNSCKVVFNKEFLYIYISVSVDGTVDVYDIAVGAPDGTLTSIILNEGE